MGETHLNERSNCRHHHRVGMRVERREIRRQQHVLFMINTQTTFCIFFFLFFRLFCPPWRESISADVSVYTSRERMEDRMSSNKEL